MAATTKKRQGLGYRRSVQLLVYLVIVPMVLLLMLVIIRREANLSELQADFVSKVSHELRTPLTSIRLFAETLERSKDDPKTQEECIKMLSSETERLS